MPLLFIRHAILRHFAAARRRNASMRRRAITLFAASRAASACCCCCTRTNGLLVIYFQSAGAKPLKRQSNQAAHSNADVVMPQPATVAHYAVVLAPYHARTDVCHAAPRCRLLPVALQKCQPILMTACASARGRAMPPQPNGYVRLRRRRRRRCHAADSSFYVDRRAVFTSPSGSQVYALRMSP